MGNDSEQGGQLSPLKRAYLALEKMQARLDALEQARREPVAIVGMGCRFPGGANDPASFWHLLRDGVDAVTEVPADRWDIDAYYDPDPDTPGKMSTRWGAFLDQVDQFDPQFFGISPREAAGMDPQQRLLLEVAWEALEHAGQAPDKLSGSRTGVFVGIVNSDYGQLENGGADQLDAYYGSGNAHSIASGRLSYVLGLQGPSLSIDTACSASLVAVHLAVQSLRNGECNMAIAGGVNVILVPETTITLSRFHMMAPDGRCKTFDARADGFVRGEGCGLIVLKRLSDAMAAGDNVLAVIRGTAVNQDGPSSGLTAPNGPAQEAVMREALANGGVQPAEMTYVETHGTGTALGDPIEVQALGAALGPGRAAGKPVYLGAVKTNVGHLEAAAGIAGLIKVVLALQHREFPPSLHLQERNPFISWDRLPVEIPTTLMPWPADAPLVAGVSSFGFSGTNAHVVLAAAEAMKQQKDEGVNELQAGKLTLLTLSAKNEKALRELAGRYQDYLAAGDVSLADVAFTANTGRAHLNQRLALPAASADQARQKLAAFAAGDLPTGVITGQVHSPDAPKVAFLFTGQGSQYVGMGCSLYESEPVFRAALDRCDELLRPYLEQPLLDVLFSSQQSTVNSQQSTSEPSPFTIHHSPFTIDDTTYTQPALFALEYALAQLWLSWGIRPALVMGHSVGEYVAACIAGVFSLEDGLKLITARGRLMQALPAGGEMAAVFAGETRVAEAIAPYADQVSIAAINGPDNIVISGAGAAIQAILDELKGEGIRARRLTVSHAFHSPLMEPMLDEFEQAAASVTYSPPQIKLVSNVTGRVAARDLLTNAAYWRRHVREAVQFAAAIQTLYEQDVELFVEIGPTPTLLGMGQRCLPQGTGIWLPSLRQGRDDWQQLMQSLGALYSHGVDVDWAAFAAHSSQRRVVLPTYPFQRKRYWLEKQSTVNSQQSTINRSQFTGHNSQFPILHPLLGWRLRSALAEVQFEAILTSSAFSFLADHRVHGVSILPTTGYIEMAVAAAVIHFGPGAHLVEDMIIHEPLIVPEGEARPAQFILTPENAQGANFKIFSLEPDTGAWRLHASGRISANSNSLVDTVQLDEIRARCQEEITAEAHYQRLAERGLGFGPSLHGVVHIWRRQGEALGRVQLPTPQVEEARAYHVHPALLDACLQVLGAALLEVENKDSYLPMSLDSFQLYRQPDSQLWSHATLYPTGAGDTLAGDVRLLDESGQTVAWLQGLRLRRAGRETVINPSADRLSDWLYEISWQPKTIPAEQQLAPQQIVALVEPQLESLRQRHRLNEHQAAAAELESLSASYIIQALQKLGWQMEPGQTVQTEALADRLGVLPQHRRLLGRMLAILAEDGILAPSETAAGAEWQVQRRPAATDPETLLDELQKRYPASEPQFVLSQRCGQALAEAISGQTDPLQLLFPGGSLALAERLYQESPEALFFNTLAQEAVAGAVAQLPAGRPVRMLEIGAGTGGTTTSILPILPAERTDYLFTDISPLFVARAEEKFGRYPFVRYQVLDIERDPATQGLAEQRFDLIMAVNVLHATADLRQTLRHARQLLAPGGLLVLLEGTVPERWIDITFGLTDGWWRFSDGDVRADYPLISRQKWFTLLAETGFSDMVAAPATSAQASQALILARAAEATGAPVTEAAEGHWLIFADSSGVGRALAGQLQARGEQCLVVAPGTYKMNGAGPAQLDPAQPEEYRQLLRQATADRPLRGVIHLWSLDVPAPAEAGLLSLDSSQAAGTASVLYLVQALGSEVGAQARAGAQARLWLVTRGAQAAGTVAEEFPPAVAQAPLWGLGKVIALEHPDLHCACVDLDPAAAIDEQAQSLFGELWAQDGEEQVVYRGRRHVARLVRHTLETLDSPETAGFSDDQPVRLVTAGSGVFDDITWQAATRRAPGPGEVELRVLATGLNFRDVLNALAVRDDPEPLGSECGGIVVAVGEGVSHLAVGDEVMAVAPGSFNTFATVSADLVTAKPAHLSFTEVATLPMAFLTAHYALNRLAQIKAGDRVLIHAAAGGVGMAAVQLAQRAGAEIFGTAGNPEKRAYLKSLGVHHVMDSRSLDFVEEIKSLTGGQGVDIALNSLAGDFIPATFSALAENGRFLEIGKRDIWTPTRAAEAKPNVAYFITDLATKMAEDPALIREMFAELVQAINDGAIRPLPTHVFPQQEAPAAFRFMAQAKHIGKIVIQQLTIHNEQLTINGQSLVDNPQSSVLSPQSAIRNPQSSVLITGGLSGLGLLVAQWLVERGARHLVLMGRRAPAETARQAIEAMTQAGARVVVTQGDVANPDDISRVLAGIEAEMPPLAGIIHSAGILDDGVLLRQEWSRFRKVMAPKVDGAWYLHQLTRDKALDFFVLFSSAAAVFGSAGQANHAAANTFLDALAYYRRAQGLPALSINWGVWSEIGAAAERNIGERVATQGVGVITPQQGLEVLEQLMRGRATQVVVTPIDWTHYARQFSGNIPVFLSELAYVTQTYQIRSQATAGVIETAVTPQLDFRQRLAGIPASQQGEALLNHVNEQVVKVLGLDASQNIDPRQPLNELGLDSLMAVELRNLLGTSLALERTLPATLVFDYPTIGALTDYLARDLALAAATPEAAKPGTADVLEDIENLSDEEVERLFAQLQG